MQGSTVRLVLEDGSAVAAAVTGRRPVGITSLMSRLRAAYPAEDAIVANSGSENDAAPAAAVAPAPSQAAFLSRCIMLQAVGGAVIFGLWLSGTAGKPFEGDNAVLCWLIAGMGALGVACVFMQRWRDVNWIATHVVRIGLLGTVIGLIVAFSAAAGGGSSDPGQVKAMIASVVNGMYVSLYATLLGITANLWLKINLRLLGNDHG